MFGEDAQSKWKTLENTLLSEKTPYFSLSTGKSNVELRLENANKQNKINWNERITDKIQLPVTSKDLDGISNWMKHFSEFETRIIEDKPNVEMKKK